MPNLLNEIFVRMREENPVGESKLFPGRPKLTNTETQQRHQLKKRMLGAVVGPKGGGKPGGVDRLSEIVARKARDGVVAGTLQVTVKDGLAAEKLIEQRENRIDDRKAMLLVAGMLTGHGAPPPEEMLELEDGMTIEGDFEDLDDVDD